MTAPATATATEFFFVSMIDAGYMGGGDLDDDKRLFEFSRILVKQFNKALPPEMKLKMPPKAWLLKVRNEIAQKYAHGETRQ